MRFGVSRLFDHADDFILSINLADPTLAKPNSIFLEVAHYTRCLLLLSISNKMRQAEIQYIIPSDDQQIIIKVQCIHRKLDVLHRA